MNKPMPEGFEAYARSERTAALCARYGVGKDQIRTWRDAAGITPLLATTHSKGGRRIMKIADGFAEDAAKMSQRDLAKKYKAGPQTVRRWQRQLGIVFAEGRKSAAPVKAPAKPAHLVHNAYMTTPIDRALKDGSRAGLAADFLRKFGPVYKCNDRGSPDIAGSHWRRNSSILTDAEIIERAEYNGWSHDAWKRVA